MDINAVFADRTREQLVSELWSTGLEVTRLKNMLTACGEEMVRLGSDKTEILEAIELGERKYVNGYSIGSYNQMRDYIFKLEEGPSPRRPKHIDDMLKECRDYRPQPEAAVTAVQAMEAMQNECIELRQVMVAAAEEIHEHWKAHCDEEGYGPANLMRRLEQGIAVCYPGYSAGAFAKLENQVNVLNRRLEGMREYQKRKDAGTLFSEPVGQPVTEVSKTSYCPWKIAVVNSGDAQVLRLVEESGDEVHITEIPVESGGAHDSNLSVLHQFVNSVSKTMHMKHKWPMWWKVTEVDTMFRISMPGSLCYTLVPVEIEEAVVLENFFEYLGAVYG